MTLRQLAQDFFESPELQILFMRAAHDVDRLLPRRRPGAAGTDPLPAADAVVRAGGDRGRWQPGDHRRARRPPGASEASNMRRRSRSTGSSSRTGAPAGVELDGRRRGSQADLVVSDLGLGTDRASPARGTSTLDGRLRRRIANINYDRGQLLWANVAHPRTAPLPRRGATTRASASQPRLYWGAKDLDYLHLRYQPEIFLKGFARPPVRPVLGRQPVGHHARAGRACISSASRSSPRPAGASPTGSGARSRIGSPTTCCANGQATRPNMTPDNVIATRVYSPADIERERLNMVQGGYSAGSSIASQVGTVPPDSGAHRVSRCCSTTSTTAPPTCTRGRGSDAARATTASRRSRAPCASRARPLARDERAAPGRQARDRDRRRRRGSGASLRCTSPASEHG